jgi:excisionase family DNA binding protein
MESPVSCKAEIRAEQRLLTIQEAAGYLAVSVSTLYGWVWQRRVPFVKMGRALRFDSRDLEAFVEANKHRPPQKFSYSGGPR